MNSEIIFCVKSILSGSWMLMPDNMSSSPEL